MLVCLESLVFEEAAATALVGDGTYEIEAMADPKATEKKSVFFCSQQLKDRSPSQQYESWELEHWRMASLPVAVLPEPVSQSALLKPC